MTYLDTTYWSKPSVELPAPPKETVYRAGHWDQDAAPQPGTLAGDCASAKVLFGRGDYGDASRVYSWLSKRAEKAKDAEHFEDCLFMLAECQYAQREYPAARDNYSKLLKEFPSSKYRNEAVQRQFAIAEYWLDDTRTEMKGQEAVSDASWWDKVNHFSPLQYMPVHFEKDKPTFDQEGHAIKTCEGVYTQDPNGPLAPHALYRAGGVSFYRERYDEADTYYSLLVENYPRSQLAAPALELALQAKINQTGGAPYDGRKLVEARQLIDTALRSYPELNEKRDVLEQTLVSINKQQAEKDFNVADFYRRTNHPGAAYFYYEIVRRRYPGTEYANKATERMMELRSKVEAVQQENPLELKK